MDHEAKFTELNIEQLAQGCEAVVANAQALIAEAEILQEHKAYARAYALAHLAREELSKLPMFFRAGINLLTGRKVDWNTLNRRFRSHSQKLINDRLWQWGRVAVMTSPEISPELKKQLLLLGCSDQAIRYWNAKKNKALYVEWENGTFCTPSSKITSRQAERTIELAKFSAMDAPTMVAGLKEWAGMPKEKVLAFWESRIAELEQEGILPKT